LRQAEGHRVCQMGEWLIVNGLAAVVIRLIPPLQNYPSALVAKVISHASFWQSQLFGNIKRIGRLKHSPLEFKTD
jgi:hypothetical protein